MQVPSAPTGVTATAGNASVTLTWTASTGATSYNVKRSQTSGGPYTKIASPTAASYADSGLTNGTPYYYVVSAVNSAGESANSAEVHATPVAAVPAVPTGVSAAPGNASVTVTWTASTGATSYNVKRSGTSGGPYTTIASPSTTSYADTGLTNGVPYYFVVSAVSSGGESANSSEVTATPVAPPAAPTGLNAAAGNAQVVLSWTASAGATGYHVKRGTASGGPYTQVAAPTASPYTDTGLTNGTPYYYVVTAVNAGGESGNSAEATATPAASSSVTVNIDTLSNRHPISSFVYGGAFPKDAATITDSGLTLVRWGGNAASTYNWQLGTDNADDDYYFEDYNWSALNNSADSNSTQFIKDVHAAGSNPLMTMVMMNWVAQSPETSTTQGGVDNYHWTFSKSRDNAQQCSFDQYNTDAGNGLATDCTTHLTASSAQINRTYFPLLDDSSESCPSWATAGCASAVYRKDWAAALATAFGNTSTCPIPYFPSFVSCHLYDMDNEIDIWGGTHFDIHPNPSGYEELRDTYLTEARALKTWDPAAVRLGPVSCCWWFYWNGENGNDKGAHAGQDFLPWWLNEVYWRDQIDGVQSVDVFDIHAYPDGPDTSTYTQLEKQALATSIYRDYWDPTFTSPSGTINQVYTTSIQPNHAIPFRIPRMRAILNATYPEVPLAFTEWSAEFAGAADFSTALGDADAYGILGRERMSLATRWVAPDPANPNYQALKLYTNYDGGHHTFGTTSVSPTHNGDPNLFSVFAALGPAGTPLTIMVVNKDPANAANVTFNLSNFVGGTYTSYTLSQSSPTAIVASSSKPWSASQTFAPYTATLLVVTGAQNSVPAAEWDLNPDTIMVPAGGTVTLNPYITSAKSGGATVTLSSASFDAGGGTMSLTDANLSQTPLTGHGVITVNAGMTPGFYHFTVMSTDSSSVQQKQGGWIVVGNPPATLTKTGDGQTGGKGANLTLSATLVPGSSGGTAAGATIRFTTSAGTLSGGTYGSTTSQLATTNSSGVASVTLTLPSTAGTVTVTAEGPFQLGHPVATFTEMAN